MPRLGEAAAQICEPFDHDVSLCGIYLEEKGVRQRNLHKLVKEVVQRDRCDDRNDNNQPRSSFPTKNHRTRQGEYRRDDVADVCQSECVEDSHASQDRNPHVTITRIIRV